MADILPIHSLIYAGFDLSLFSKERTFYYDPDQNIPTYHSTSSCYGSYGYRRSYSTLSGTAKLDRIKIPVSKACYECFEKAFSDAPDFYEFRNFAKAYLYDSSKVRKLKTAFSTHSKKNTLESTASTIRFLDEMHKSIKGAKTSNAELNVGVSDFLSRLEKQGNVLRKTLQSKDEQEIFEKPILIHGSISDDNKNVIKTEYFNYIKDLMGGSPRNYRKDIVRDLLGSSVSVWTKTLTESNDVNLAKNKFKNFLIEDNKAVLVRQTNFVPEIPILPGEKLNDYVERAWLEEFTARVEVLTSRMVEDYEKALSEKEKHLIEVDLYSMNSPEHKDDDVKILLQAALNLIESSSIRSEGQRRLLVLNKGVLLSLSHLDLSYGSLFKSGAVSVEGLSSEVIEIASSLYTFGEGTTALKEALANAKDLAGS